ncbi:MAG: hypothetical protein GFH27_549293n248 [Chloroflexi bacterium AL-W]|nr:hypothetical protein [Chloroflexi bacterium AL-N1]NOK67637.1 hypothetical protein [Chloroflexi bacterium AL-N10]NOK75593.1 hypothetical protein [Chloroflexi bacterium AL-N5]NOK82381.1 hypothetical protein [Chloroflexi bacterium AL-W]NOK90226.1 hypothetical protein [Chloroflexi bacterium AL-N15]
MNQPEVEAFVTKLDNVQQEETFGYTFFFVGDDHRLPFVTIGCSDNEFDDVSNLNREGVFRINIGVSKKTYEALLANSDSEAIDYAVLDVFLPHPHYSKQHFVCILNPTQKNVDITKHLIVEAHSIAEIRFQKRLKK